MRQIAIEIDGVDVIGVGAHQVHHVADDERLTLLAAKGASDIVQATCSLSAFWVLIWLSLLWRVPLIVPERHHPLVSVLGHRVE